MSFGPPARQSAKEAQVRLPFMSQPQHVAEDYRTTSLSLKAHPMVFFREDLSREKVVPCAALKTARDRRRLSVGGLVLVRQRPGTAKGVVFMTLEDETGIANAIVWLRTFERYRPIVMGARLVSVTGILQNEKGVIHIVADRFDDLTPLLRRLSADEGGIEARSRADMVKSDNPDRFRHPRSGDSFVRMAKRGPLLERLAAAEHAAQVMPKGRNFH